MDDRRMDDRREFGLCQTRSCPVARKAAGQIPQALRFGRGQYRRDIDLLPAAAGAPHAYEEHQHARKPEPRRSSGARIWYGSSLRRPFHGRLRPEPKAVRGRCEGLACATNENRLEPSATPTWSIRASTRKRLCESWPPDGGRPRPHRSVMDFAELDAPTFANHALHAPSRETLMRKASCTSH